MLLTAVCFCQVQRRKRNEKYRNEAIADFPSISLHKYLSFYLQSFKGSFKGEFYRKLINVIGLICTHTNTNIYLDYYAHRDSYEKYLHHFSCIEHQIHIHINIEIYTHANIILNAFKFHQKCRDKFKKKMKNKIERTRQNGRQEVREKLVERKAYIFQRTNLDNVLNNFHKGVEFVLLNLEC